MGKVKMSLYGHSVVMAILGIWATSYEYVPASFLGGLLIGYGLRLAYTAGQQSER